MEHENKKKNYPAPGKFDKVDVDIDKGKMKGDIDKAERGGSIEGTMRFSIDYPGVGSYNKYHNEDKRASKWMQEKGKKAD